MRKGPELSVVSRASHSGFPGFSPLMSNFIKKTHSRPIQKIQTTQAVLTGMAGNQSR